jgi:hypothetical protein
MNKTPQKPYTTEGMPANSWMAGLNMFLSAAGANSAKKILQQMAMGTPIIAAPKVTDTEPNHREDTIGTLAGSPLHPKNKV